jgi:glycopeptide antibiotics resistance protein
MYSSTYPNRTYPNTNKNIQEKIIKKQQNYQNIINNYIAKKNRQKIYNEKEQQNFSNIYSKGAIEENSNSPNDTNNEENNINDKLIYLLKNFFDDYETEEITHNTHSTYIKQFKSLIKNINNKNKSEYKKICKRQFFTKIPEDTIYYKSFGNYSNNRLDTTKFKNAPFLWFALKAEDAEKYINQNTSSPVYIFKVKKELKLINMCSYDFIKDFKKKINTIFVDYEFIRNLLFLPFGYISHLLQKYYLSKYLGIPRHTSNDILQQIIKKYQSIDIYNYLLLKGNRYSIYMSDTILMFVLMKLYPKYDGYIAIENDYEFHPEICIFNPDKKIEYDSVFSRGGGFKLNKLKNINLENSINNPLQYKIENNIETMIQLKKFLHTFIDKVIQTNNKYVI